MSPSAWRQIYTELGLILHWSLSDLDNAYWTELVLFHRDAVRLFNRLHGGKPEGEK